MDSATIRPVTRRRRLWQTISTLRHRLLQQRELLAHPGMELAAARQMNRTRRRLEVLRSQVR